MASGYDDVVATGTRAFDVRLGALDGLADHRLQLASSRSPATTFSPSLWSGAFDTAPAGAFDTAPVISRIYHIATIRS
jgi:hypothetical protein